MDSDLLSIIQLGCAFFFILSAFNSQGFVEITILRTIAIEDFSSGFNEKSGFYSLAIIYFTFTFSNLLAPTVVSWYGPKWTMVLGSVFYCLFMFGFLFRRAFLLHILSVLLGFGAAMLWTGQGAYLSTCSRTDTVSRNSGILWAIQQANFIFGGSFLFAMFFASSIVTSTNALYGSFTAITALGILTLIYLPQKSFCHSEIYVEVNGSNSNSSIQSTTFPQITRSHTIPCADEFRNTIRLLCTQRMMLLSVVFIYSGLELTFYTGVYSTCLAAFRSLNDSKGLIVAFNALAVGFGQIIGGLVFGVCANRFSITKNRNLVIITGLIVHCIAFFLIFLNIPPDAALRQTDAVGYMSPNYYIALSCGTLLGFADSCWNTQIYSLLSSYYSINSANAFAIFKFFQSLAACGSFFYGSVLLLHWQLLILVLTATIAALCFIYVEMNELAMYAPPIF